MMSDQANPYYEMFEQCKLERDFLKSELKKLREERDKLQEEITEARRVIDSIACTDESRLSDFVFLYELPKNELAEMVSNDTTLAREFLTKYPALKDIGEV